jgi:hypothetical protein
MMQRLGKSVGLALLFLVHPTICSSTTYSGLATTALNLPEANCGDACHDDKLYDKLLGFNTDAPSAMPSYASSAVPIATLPPAFQPGDTTYSSSNSVDFLVAAFFLISAGWLILALVYSALIIFIIRRRAIGEMDMYDEDFGRIYLIGRRCFIPLGCILRRYMTNLDNNTEPVRYMTREERRAAMEILLSRAEQSLLGGDVIGRNEGANNRAERTDMNTHESVRQRDGSEPDQSLNTLTLNVSTEEESGNDPTCSICLMEYENPAEIFASTTCSHQFHHACICDWLERRTNTECPCCRNPLVSDAEVWETVQGVRRERRKQYLQEHGRTSIVGLLCSCCWSPKPNERNRTNREAGTISHMDVTEVLSPRDDGGAQTGGHGTSLQPWDIETGQSAVVETPEESDIRQIENEILASSVPRESLVGSNDEQFLLAQSGSLQVTSRLVAENENRTAKTSQIRDTDAIVMPVETEHSEAEHATPSSASSTSSDMYEK